MNEPAPSRLCELLDELAVELGPPDEDMVDEALDTVHAVVAAWAPRPAAALMRDRSLVGSRRRGADPAHGPGDEQRADPR